MLEGKILTARNITTTVSRPELRKVAYIRGKHVCDHCKVGIFYTRAFNSDWCQGCYED